MDDKSVHLKGWTSYKFHGGDGPLWSPSGKPMRLHTKVSLIKSIFRILAGASLIGGFFIAAGVNLIIAEVLGIIEEIDS